MYHKNNADIQIGIINTNKSNMLCALLPHTLSLSLNSNIMVTHYVNMITNHSFHSGSKEPLLLLLLHNLTYLTGTHGEVFETAHAVEMLSPEK